MSEQRRAKNGILYEKKGDEWFPVQRTAKDGTTYISSGLDEWTPQQVEEQKPTSTFEKVLNTTELGAVPARLALAKALGQYKSEDFSSPIEKGIPSSYELMDRAGYGGSNDPLEVSPFKHKLGRQALGIGLDIVTDASNYTPLLATKAAKLGKLAQYGLKALEITSNPVAEGLIGGVKLGKKTGETLYKKGLSSLDNKVMPILERLPNVRNEFQGKDLKNLAPSEILYREGMPIINEDSGISKIMDVTENIKTKRNDILKNKPKSRNFDPEKVIEDYRKDLVDKIKIEMGNSNLPPSEVAQGYIDELEGLMRYKATLADRGDDAIHQANLAKKIQYEKDLKAGLNPSQPIYVNPYDDVSPFEINQLKDGLDRSKKEVSFDKKAVRSGLRKEAANMSNDPREIHRLNAERQSLFNAIEKQPLVNSKNQSKKDFGVSDAVLASASPKTAISNYILRNSLSSVPMQAAGKTLHNINAKILPESVFGKVMTRTLTNPYDYLLRDDN